MGKGKSYRFPKSINCCDRIYSNKHKRSKANSPTNYVTDIFGLNEMVSEGDYLGSYTGNPLDGMDYPIQDADDL